MNSFIKQYKNPSKIINDSNLTIKIMSQTFSRQIRSHLTQSHAQEEIISLENVISDTDVKMQNIQDCHCEELNKLSKLSKIKLKSLKNQQSAYLSKKVDTLEAKYRQISKSLGNYSKKQFSQSLKKNDGAKLDQIQTKLFQGLDQFPSLLSQDEQPRQLAEVQTQPPFTEEDQRNFIQPSSKVYQTQESKRRLLNSNQDLSFLEGDLRIEGDSLMRDAFEEEISTIEKHFEEIADESIELMQNLQLQNNFQQLTIEDLKREVVCLSEQLRECIKMSEEYHSWYSNRISAERLVHQEQIQKQQKLIKQLRAIQERNQTPLVQQLHQTLEIKGKEAKEYFELVQRYRSHFNSLAFKDLL